VGKKHKLFLVFTLLLFSFSTISTFTAPKVSAAEDMPGKVDTFFKLQTFRRCINNVGISSTLVKGESNTVFGTVDGVTWRSSGTTISTGYVVDPDNGEWACGIGSHADDWFKLIGYKNFKDFRDQKYKSKGSDSSLLELKGSKDTITKEVKDAISDKMPNITGYMRYYNYFKAFKKCASGPKNKNDINGTTITIKNYVKLDGTVVKDASFERTEADQIPVGHYAEGDDRPEDGKQACETIAERLDQYSDNYKKWADENKEEVTAIEEGGSASSDPDNDDSCEAQTGVLAWVGCPVVNLISGTLNWIDAQLNRLMIIDRPLYASNEQMYEAWSRFRNIGLSILVIAMLVMVISTALSLNFLDAYTVKKAFPRMVAAIVFITLSWWICVFLIDLFNVIGQGILGIMTAPFGLTDPALSELFYVNAGGAVAQGSVLIAITASAFLVPGALGILMSWLGAALLVMAIAFITLVARQMFVIVLVLFSPLAILSWIFPNNDKLWKFWWGTFTKLLLMYPMVMALIGAGRIFASVIATTSAGGAEGGLINPLLKLTAYVLPYAFIPFTFKAAGGVFGNLVGMANDRSKGAFDRLRKSRQKNMSMIGENAKTGNFVRGSGALSDRVNTRTQRMAHLNKAGLRPGRMRSNLDTAVGATDRLELEKQAKENTDYATWAGNDGLNRMATESTNEADLRTAMIASGDYVGREDQMEADIARVERLRKQTSSAVFRTLTHKNATKGGTAFDTSAEWLRSAVAASGGDDAVLADLIATGRSDLMSAGRVDQGGAGFGRTLEVARALRDGNPDGTAMTDAQANAAIHSNVLESQGPGVIAHSSMKPGAIRELIPDLRQRILTAQNEVAAAEASGDTQRMGQAADAMDRELAIVSSMYDSMASSSPQNARILGDEVMNWDPSTGINGVAVPLTASQRPLPAGVSGPVQPHNMNIQELAESRRGSRMFVTTRRELNQQQQQQGQVGGGAVGNAPPPIAPAP
jgi:hypothetical protein